MTERSQGIEGIWPEQQEEQRCPFTQMENSEGEAALRSENWGLCFAYINFRLHGIRGDAGGGILRVSQDH